LDEQDLSQTPLRTQQLEFRRHEVYTTYSTFCRFLRDDPTLKLDTIGGSGFDKKSWVVSGDDVLKIRIDEKVTLVGHSFGGATLVRTIRILYARLMRRISFLCSRQIPRMATHRYQPIVASSWTLG
jgi:pimeloyl-ACP methyl ester carboxylesterase